MDTRESLVKDLKNDIRWRRIWEFFDFMFAETLTWIAILIGFCSALAAALQWEKARSLRLAAALQH